MDMARPLIEIRPTESGDAIERFGPLHGLDEDAPRPRRSFVAVAEGQLVGCATASGSIRHPSRHLLDCVIDEPYRRRMIGSRLLDALTEALPGPKLARLDAPTRAARAFLHSRGFVPANRSWSGRINPDNELQLGPLPAGYRIEPRTRLEPSLVDLYERIYAECHWWAPPARDPETPAWIELAGPPIAGGIHVVLDPWDEPVGVTSLHEVPRPDGDDDADSDDAPRTAFLPPTAIINGGRRRWSRDLMGHLVAAAFDAAKRAAYDRVVVEVEDPYVELAFVLEPITLEDVSVVEFWVDG